MKIVFIDGGLGNQVFQYIFYRYLQEKQTDPVYLDDRAFFYSDAHNGWEMPRVFGVKPNLLSEYFAPDVWKEILAITADKIHIIDLFKQNGLDFDVVSENDWVNYNLYNVEKTREALKIKEEYPNALTTKYNKPFVSVKAHGFHPHIAKMPGKVYYHGYWINANYLKEIRKLILDELKFPPIEDDYNKELAEKISRPNSVIIHVRCGDYVSMGWVKKEHYKFYENSVAEIKKRVYLPEFFIFSDDPDWCSQNLKVLGLGKNDNITFVDGNLGKNAFRDCQLMSMCRHMIFLNSTFSYLAALLNQNKNKIVFQLRGEII